MSDIVIKESCDHPNRPTENTACGCWICPDCGHFNGCRPLDIPDSLSNSVAKLESTSDSYKSLAGEILATIKVNLDRGCIVTKKPEAKAQLDGLVEVWQERIKKIALQ